MSSMVILAASVFAILLWKNRHTDKYRCKPYPCYCCKHR